MITTDLKMGDYVLIRNWKSWDVENIEELNWVAKVEQVVLDTGGAQPFVKVMVRIQDKPRAESWELPEDLRKIEREQFAHLYI